MFYSVMASFQASFIYNLYFLWECVKTKRAALTETKMAVGQFRGYTFYYYLLVEISQEETILKQTQIY